MGHKLKYLSQYFPTIYEYKLKNPTTEAVDDMCRLVERCFGRLKVWVVKGKRNFKDKVEEIHSHVQSGQHFKGDQRILDMAMKKIAEPKEHALDCKEDKTGDLDKSLKDFDSGDLSPVSSDDEEDA